MADPTEAIAHHNANGFTFVDNPPITEVVALDLLAAMGLGDIVAAYRTNKDAGQDPRFVLDVDVTVGPEPTCFCNGYQTSVAQMTGEPSAGNTGHVVGVAGCEYAD
jgi:hypothetical protein